MFRFFRRRAADSDVVARLFGLMDEQVEAVINDHGFAPARMAQSFYLHDYAFGLLRAAIRAGLLGKRDARRRFADYFTEKFGLSRAAALSCFKASGDQYAQQPGGAGFADGLADAAALMSSRIPAAHLRRNFMLHAEGDWSPAA